MYSSDRNKKIVKQFLKIVKHGAKVFQQKLQS